MGRNTVILSLILGWLVCFTAACSASPTPASPAVQEITTVVPSPTPLPPSAIPRSTHTPTASPTPSPVPRLVPAFEHITIIILENKEFVTVIGNPQMPHFNRWAQEYSLLTQYYAIRKPSLPNYLALVGGDTFGVDTNYPGGLIDAPSLPDLIEASGRTWKGYMESMPEPCALQDTLSYVQKHNPFVYFEAIRNDPERCRRGVVPLSELENDLAQGALPNFLFIVPNICHSAHDAHINPDCGLAVADQWLESWVVRLLDYPSFAQNGLLVLTWDEGQGEQTCCGLPSPGGGRVATILISARAKSGFQDDTPYTHYSLPKTIAAAWDLPLLAQAADERNALMTAPWKGE